VADQDRAGHSRRPGTNAIVRLTCKSKPCVWRWQERYVFEGIEGVKRDKTRPSRKPPLSAETKVAVLKKTTTEKPAGATNWSARKLAKVFGLSHRSIQQMLILLPNLKRQRSWRACPFAHLATWTFESATITGTTSA
jgi:hypothetical protein